MFGKEIIKNGNLVDSYGNPIIFRFLVLPNGSNKPIEKVYIWSYGEDGINGINATPIYKNKGAPNLRFH